MVAYAGQIHSNSAKLSGKFCPMQAKNRKGKDSRRPFVSLKTFALSLPSPISATTTQEQKSVFLIFILILIVILIFIWLCNSYYRCMCITPCWISHLHYHERLQVGKDGIETCLAVMTLFHYLAFHRLPGLQLEITSRNSSRHIFEHAPGAGINTLNAYLLIHLS